jgi:NAD(P)-dependent dehydrogenase (short-subunit alcohol dehydrogenase family)
VSKAGIVALTHALASELKGTGVTVNAVAPGTILTAANKESMPDADASLWVPPEDIAALILSLCRLSSGSISGNVIKMERRV